MITCVLKWILHQKSHFHPTTRIPNSFLLLLLFCHKTVQQKRLRVRSAGSKILIFKEMHVVRKVLQLRISLCSLSQFRRKHCVRNPLCNPKMSLNWTGCYFVAFAVVCHLKRANSIFGIFYQTRVRSLFTLVTNSLTD